MWRNIVQEYIRRRLHKPAWSEMIMMANLPRLSTTAQPRGWLMSADDAEDARLLNIITKVPYNRDVVSS